MKSAAFLIIAFIGFSFIFVGLHAVDNAWNMAYITKTFDIHLTDQAALGQPVDYNIVYRNGLMMVLAGTLIGFSGLALWGYEERKLKC